jgi:predicted dehydrogenase
MGVAHAVGTQARFSPGLIYAKELMGEAYVGRPLFFHMTHFLSSALQPRPSHRWWSMRAEEGGGQVQTLVRETRFADTGEVVPVDAIDTVAFMARLASGVSGTVHVSNACKQGSGFHLDIFGTEGRLSVESTNMVQYSPAKVFGAQGSGVLQELPVPPRLHTVPGLPAEHQALQVAQLLRQLIRSVHTGAAFRPNFSDAVGLHRTLEAVVCSSASGRWEAVA